MGDVNEPVLSPALAGSLWTELGVLLSSTCETHESIDDALRGWLDVATQLRVHAPDSQDDVVGCAQMLLECRLFQDNKHYVRTQIIHSLLQEDDDGFLHAIVCLLLLDGQSDESTFPRMLDEACFGRLLELLNTQRDDADPRLYQLLLQLLYEMSRVQRIDADDLMLVQDDFVHSLFQDIEGDSNDAHDPYHYPTIRVLLVLNEQYMLASTDPATDVDAPSSPPPTNRIVKCLSLHGPLFRTFGENIILLLNRETETALQLLILKLLYLLFTTKATYEYFYTNDLRVLVDVIIRNLMDLPDEKISLRHTYLRVMYPLLAYTQLSEPPHYKRDEVLRVLSILRGSDNAHFAPADETTLRLVDRVAKVGWLGGEANEDRESWDQAKVARKILGVSLSPSQYASSASVDDVAGVTERPGVQTPSRGHADEAAVDTGTPDEVAVAVKTKKPLPAVPRHRHGIPVTQVDVDGERKRIPPKAPPPRRFGRMKDVQQPSAPYS
ncbi:Phospholipid:diacylglycerol acyltransferase [Ophiocordyceps camponoti-floridani]|uniref:Phospholipid:diacylglycerol acyltransferase n=1 Tax=Ophiocordyceps camponoti-floridani TaxID=2030778 RepID=A0A8H4Q7R6_9HYPO|nr:Phospholipid:diacylglycerol acyltransferase [Ophiocordyceps camponoti-floridani]